MTAMHVPRIPRAEQETVIQADSGGVIAYTTDPAVWRALKRRAKALGGSIETTHLEEGNPHNREVGGQVRLPAFAWSTARFGLRSRPPKVAA